MFIKAGVDMVRDAEIVGIERREFWLCTVEDRLCSLCDRTVPNKDIKCYIKTRWGNLWACEECVLDRGLVW